MWLDGAKAIGLGGKEQNFEALKNHKRIRVTANEVCRRTTGTIETLKERSCDCLQKSRIMPSLGTAGRRRWCLVMAPSTGCAGLGLTVRLCSVVSSTHKSAGPGALRP